MFSLNIIEQEIPEFELNDKEGTVMCFQGGPLTFSCNYSING